MEAEIPVRPFVGPRCWRPKVCYQSIADAELAAHSLMQLDHEQGIDPGRLCIIYCPRHCSFHVAHDLRRPRP